MTFAETLVKYARRLPRRLVRRNLGEGGSLGEEGLAKAGGSFWKPIEGPRGLRQTLNLIYQTADETWTIISSDLRRCKVPFSE